MSGIEVHLRDVTNLAGVADAHLDPEREIHDGTDEVRSAVSTLTAPLPVADEHFDPCEPAESGRAIRPPGARTRKATCRRVEPTINELAKLINAIRKVATTDLISHRAGGGYLSAALADPTPARVSGAN